MPYRAQSDRVDGVVVTFGDVTRLRRAEERTRRLAEEWERTFDSVPDLIAILDDRHRVVRANRAMAERLGLAPEQCVGLLCYKAVHGTDAPPDFCPHTQTLVDSREHTTEVHEDRLGGDFLVSTTPMFSPEGKMTGTVHIARDITKRKRAEEALRESEEKYRIIVETANEGIWITDAERKTILINRKWRTCWDSRWRKCEAEPHRNFLMQGRNNSR